jgi:hypothetical protein
LRTPLEREGEADEADQDPGVEIDRRRRRREDDAASEREGRRVTEE